MSRKRRAALPSEPADPGATQAAEDLLKRVDRRVDLYLVWAIVTDFRVYRRAQAYWPQAFSGLIELRQPLTSATWPPDAALPGPAGSRMLELAGVRIEVPDAYCVPITGTGPWPRHITWRMPLDDKLDAGRLGQQLVRLAGAEEVARMVFGYPRPSWRDADVDAARAWPPLPAPVTPPSRPIATPASLVFGVIENSCPFAHPALRDAAGRTRVAALWDQAGGRRLAPWQRLPGFPYGQVLDRAGMDSLMRAHARPNGTLDEEALYQDPRTGMPLLARRASHGAAVAGMLAGRRYGPGAVPAPLDEPGAWQPADDGLDDAPVLGVLLPRENTWISAGRWLGVQVLDAVHFLRAQRRVAHGEATPLVVNLSYGALAGPHDGTTPLEAALAELCDADPSLAIVVAAGNAHGTVVPDDQVPDGPASPVGVHATGMVAAGGAWTCRLAVPADKSTETYLEIWLRAIGGGELNDEQLMSLQVEVTGPGGIGLQAQPDTVAVHREPDGRPVAGLLFAARPAQSRVGAMVLLALAATRLNPKYVAAPPGGWTVVVRREGVPAEGVVEVDAWVERDDPGEAAATGQQARLVGHGQAGGAVVTNQASFSSLANVQARGLFACGALRRGPAGLEPSPYSSAGVDDAHGPRLSALADGTVALPGLRVIGNQVGVVARTNGTSLAAPLAARWLAAALAQGQDRDDLWRQSTPADARTATWRVEP